MFTFRSAVAADTGVGVLLWMLVGSLRGDKVPVADPTNGSPTFLGCLEQGQEETAAGARRDYQRIRVAFRRSRDGWQAMPQMPRDSSELRSIVSAYPAAVQWTVAFNGDRLGEVRSRNPDLIDSYGSVGVQAIESLPPKVRVGEPDREFGGWSSSLTYRPLVVVSQPHWRDPEAWKRASGFWPVPRSLADMFRDALQRHGYCEYIGQEPFDSGKPLAQSDIIVLRRYVSRKGDMIVSLGLKQQAVRCDLALEHEPRAGHWFVVTAKAIKHLGPDLRWVDAGDYDGSGDTEVVLWYSGSNRDGYVLLWDRLSRSETFVWSYH